MKKNPQRDRERAFLDHQITDYPRPCGGFAFTRENHQTRQRHIGIGLAPKNSSIEGLRAASNPKYCKRDKLARNDNDLFISSLTLQLYANLWLRSNLYLVNEAARRAVARVPIRYLVEAANPEELHWRTTLSRLNTVNSSFARRGLIIEYYLYILCASAKELRARSSAVG